MDTNTTQPASKTTAKDFFLNLGAIVALYTIVIALINLLFRVINAAYPQTTVSYYGLGSQSISFPVATLIIFLPIFILLMWLLEKGFETEPEKRNAGVRRWLTYITLFISGLVLAGDLITVLYYFLDGQEMTTAFLLKFASVFVVILAVFAYYISDVRGKLTSNGRRIWSGVAVLAVLISIIAGFAVLGSPRTQQLLKYDSQKVSDLQQINSQVQSYYSMKGSLPSALKDLTGQPIYFTVPLDGQNQTQYEYRTTGQNSYELCATFNKSSQDKNGMNGVGYSPSYYSGFYNHPADRYCFSMEVNPNSYRQATPVVPMVKPL